MIVGLAFLSALASSYAQSTDSRITALLTTGAGVNIQSDSGSTVRANPPASVDKTKCLELAIQAYAATMQGKNVSSTVDALKIAQSIEAIADWFVTYLSKP